MSAVLRFLAAVGLPLLVGGVAGIATAGGVRDWYPSLVKPPFNPPSWVFGPVWTALYLMMGVAAFLVWQKGLEEEGVRIALLLFLVQLALNGLWSFLFFAFRSPGFAFLEILVLWLAIGATLVLFWRVTFWAGALLIPYQAWVTFAAILNGSIWWLNR